MASPALRILRLTAVLALAAACTPPADAPSSPAPRLDLEPCRFEGLDEELQCGTLPVAENPAEPDGRRIDLNVVVLPALGEDKAPDPIFYFEGGPGGASAGNPANQAWMFAALRQRRDVVLVDQRGTGKSHTLDCPAPGSLDDLQGFLEPYLPLDMVETCRDELARKADLGLYTTSIGMDDVDTVRRALGYDKINLTGGSYGTRAAQVYMRRHPSTVRTVMLLGTAAMHQHLPLYHARDAQRTLDLLFEICSADEPCAAAFPDLEGDFHRLMARLAQGPVEVTVPHPTRGDDVTLRVGADGIAESLRFLFYSPGTFTLVPSVLHQAAVGDLGFLTRLILIAQSEIRKAMSFGMHLSVTCAEDRPFYPPGFEEELDGTFLGDYRVRQILDACDVWPRGEIPADYHDPVTVDVPTLLVSGYLDPVTPPSWADQVDAALPDSLHVVIDEGHHSFGGLSNIECFSDFTARFVEAGTTAGLDTSCAQTMQRGEFLTDASALEALMKDFEADVWKEESVPGFA